MTNKDKSFQQWKKHYKKIQKAEKKKNTFITILSIFLLFLCSLLIYYWWIDELKFLGRKTTSIKAIVINERKIHWGKGYYYQVGNCNYIFEEKKYSTDFRINNYFFWVNVGDTIALKIVVNKPSISKVIN